MSERCKAIDKDLSRNGSGYYDPTAYKAMKRVEADEKKYGRDYERFYNLLNTIFFIFVIWLGFIWKVGLC